MIEIESSFDAQNLAYAMRAGVCQPAKKSPKTDPYGLGFRVIDTPESLKVKILHCRYASAEAIATLGIIKRSFAGQRELEFIPDSQSTQLLNVTGLSDLSYDTQPPLWRITELYGCYYLPLTWVIPNKREDCYLYAEEISNWLSKLPPDLRIDSNLLPIALTRLAHEALLNAFDHAYVTGDSQGAAVSISVTPVKVPFKTDVKDVETQWLSTVESRGFVLEIAIADWGLGIPKTLWRNFKTHHPDQFQQLMQSVKSNNEQLRRRAQLQSLICKWAFNHISTRRSNENFASEATWLNPRGLHRALNAVHRCSGCLLVRSGRARTGYVSIGDSVASMLHKDGLAEIPGTTIVGRFPNEFAKASLSLAYPTQRQEQLLIDSVLAVPDLPDSPAAIIRDPETRQQHRTGIDIICLPFLTLDHNELPRLNFFLRSRGQHRILGVASAKIPDQELHSLCAFSPTCDPQMTPPRVCALLQPDGHIEYKIWGELPESARSVHMRLERQGATVCENDNDCAFAKSLADEYPNIFAFDVNDKTIRIHHTSILNPAQSTEVFQKSLDALRLSRREKKWIIQCRQNECFSLSNGRLVRQIFSITLLMQEVLMLSEQISHRLVEYLTRIEACGSTCLVADTHSSFFLLRRLLGNHKIDVDTRRVPAGVWSNVVLFCDAIYKGQTLHDCIHELGGKVTHTLIGFDLSQKDTALSSVNPPNPTVLVKWGFDPLPLVDRDRTKGMNVIELDTLTNLPRRSDRYARFLLGDIQESNQILIGDMNCFRFGLHRIGGKIHTVSINTDYLLAHFALDIIKCLKRIIVDWISSHNNSDVMDVLLVARTGTSISGRLQKLASDIEMVLSSDLKERTAVFVSLFDFSPERGRSIHARTKDNVSIINDATPTQPGDLFQKLNEKYCVVYIDSAASSGRTLFNVLNELCSYNDQAPLAVLAIPMVLRLSPYEERFLSHCTLTNEERGPVKNGSIPFMLRSLFRLQVQTYDSLYATPIYEELSNLTQPEPLLDKAARNYITGVRKKVQSTIKEDSCCCHPWYPKNETCSSGSFLSAQLRHTVALIEQNEGGLEELRSQLLQIVQQGDLCPLSLFAVEPALLQLEPLQHEFRHFAVELAKLAIGGCDSYSVSDAIVVLAQYPREFVTLLYPLMEYCVKDVDLLAQLSVFLVHLILKDHDLGHEVLQKLHVKLADASALAAISTESAAHLHAMIRLNMDLMARPHMAAEDLILDALRTLYRHHKNDAALLDFRHCVTIGNIPEIKRRAADIIEMYEKVVVPAFWGVSEWCDQHDAPAEAEEARSSMLTLVKQLQIMKQAVCSELPIIEDIRQTWQNIMGLTLDISLDAALSAQDIPSEKPVLQRLLTQCFCSPFDIVRTLVLKRFPNAIIEVAGGSYATALESNCYFLIVSGGVDSLTQIMQQLLDNAETYGKPDSVVLQVNVSVDGDEQRRISFCLSNAKNERKEKGQQKGLPLIREIAAQVGWHFDPSGSDSTSGTWHATIVFPIVFIITPSTKEIV